MQCGQAHVDDRHNVRVLEVSLGFDLAADEQVAFDAVELVLVQQLERDQAAIGRVPRQPHLAHPAFAQLAIQLIRSDQLGRLGQP